MTESRAHCGSSDANQFIRDGHYRRSLETGWRQLDEVRVPMLECQRCEHDVLSHITPTRAQEWAATLGASVGLRTINERINQLEALLAQVHREPISEVPAVVQFDGIWLEPGRPSRTVSTRIAASASVTAPGANAWWCWSPSACGRMGATNGKSWIGR